MLEKFRSLAIGLCLLAIAAGLAAYFMVQMGSGEKLFGGGSGTLPPVEFESLTYDGTEPGYLLCPDDLCTTATANGPAPRFEVNARTLRLALADYTDNMPTIRTFRFDPAANQFDFTERLPGESFPAVLTVRILDKGPYASELVIYSRKPVGDNEPGEHEKRVNRWINLLTSRLGS
ncbi:MAG: hypothetical protein HWE08_05265 [Alphaproteobacteria bacterium]|nr:hypothetical protein [Alphaproteobacteria bacterium]